MNLTELKNLMRHHVIIDGRNVLDINKLVFNNRLK